jgi:putative ABC transport system substrate-binding protein
VRRREFITLLGGATAWPLAVRAQQPATPRIGFLHSASPEPLQHILVGLRRGLQEGGFVEGQNVSIEYQWARGQNERLPELATDLVRRQPSVIVAGGGELAARAAKAATAVIPIVFTTAGDPVKFGLVASLNRPGGNLTGIVTFTSVVETKKFGLLKEMVPKATAISMLINPKYPRAEPDAIEVGAAAKSVGCKLNVSRVSDPREVEAIFAALAQQQPDALLVAGDPFFNALREQLVKLSTQYSLPTIYEFREYVAAGGLMSYGISLPDNYRQMGLYVSRILKGAKPADLPVIQPTKFEFTINLKTAKALGVAVPPTLLATADEVIE